MKIETLQNIIIKLFQDQNRWPSCEADFQLALGWKIREEYALDDIVLEDFHHYEFKSWARGKGGWKLDGNVRKAPIYHDIVFRYKGKQYCIELKYKTDPVLGVAEDCLLKSHGAQSHSRFHIWKDVERLEKFCQGSRNRKGFLIFLTNYAGYKTNDGRGSGQLESDAAYAGFSLHPGFVMPSGASGWGVSRPPCSREGHKWQNGVFLSREYSITEKNWSTFEIKDEPFQSLIIAV